MRPDYKPVSFARENEEVRGISLGRWSLTVTGGGSMWRGSRGEAAGRGISH